MTTRRCSLTSFFSKNLGRLKEYLQENNKIKGIIDMADHLGSNRNSLRWYISGEQEPSVGFLRKISNLYDVNMDWLLENRGPMFRDVGIENASRIFLQSTETERSIIFTKFKLSRWRRRWCVGLCSGCEWLFIDGHVCLEHISFSWIARFWGPDFRKV